MGTSSSVPTIARIRRGERGPLLSPTPLVLVRGAAVGNGWRCKTVVGQGGVPAGKYGEVYGEDAANAGVVSGAVTGGGRGEAGKLLVIRW